MSSVAGRGTSAPQSFPEVSSPLLSQETPRPVPSSTLWCLCSCLPLPTLSVLSCTPLLCLHVCWLVPTLHPPPQLWAVSPQRAGGWWPGFEREMEQENQLLLLSSSLFLLRGAEVYSPSRLPSMVLVSGLNLGTRDSVQIPNVGDKTPVLGTIAITSQVFLGRKLESGARARSCRAGCRCTNGYLNAWPTLLSFDCNHAFPPCVF